MKWIDYENAKTVDEAVKILSQSGGKARPMAGGTDLIVQLRVKDPRVDADVVVNVKDIPELNELSYSATKGLTIGAAVPCHKIYNDSNVITHYPALIDSASLIGGTQIQGRASLGGNLCNAAPSGDSIPNLVAHNGVATLAGPNGTREVAVEDVCTGPRQTCIGKDEILVSINLPNPGEGFGANYIRFIPRNEMDIAVVGAGVSVNISGGKFTAAKVSLASVAPTPISVPNAISALVGESVGDGPIQNAANAAKEAAKPISDMRGTAEYRKHLCEVLTRRALNTAVERAQGGK
ncbi:MAG: xanthine dehydrogenase family protein subunit M [Chloroflexota bacterium]|nr:xanthine dehydrogenase family protein subunit M [Chloroflexota bacterium]